MFSEHSELARMMEGLKPGFLPEDIFLQIARVYVTTTVDILPIRADSYPDTQILLLNRGPQDEIWKNMLHVPGSVVRATDESYNEAFKRILQEIGGVKIEEGPRFVGIPFLQYTERGRESVLVHWATISGKPEHGQYYSVNNLPSAIIPGQLPRLRLAIGHFNSSRF